MFEKLPSGLNVKALVEMVQTGQLQEVIMTIVGYTEYHCRKQFYRDAIAISARHWRLEEDFRKGIVSYEDYSVNLNRIIIAVLAQLDQLAQVNGLGAVQRERRTQVTINSDIDSFDSERLQRLLAAHLDIHEDEIFIEKITAGSVHVIFWLPVIQAKRLIEAFQNISQIRLGLEAAYDFIEIRNFEDPPTVIKLGASTPSSKAYSIYDFDHSSQAVLFVGNLPFAVTEKDLIALFEKVGKISDILIPKYQDTGRSRGFGMVQMETSAAAQRVIDAFHEVEFMGRKLTVNIARPPQRREGGFGKRGGRSSEV